jgi:hypothetical protein
MQTTLFLSSSSLFFHKYPAPFSHHVLLRKYVLTLPISPITTVLKHRHPTTECMIYIPSYIIQRASFWLVGPIANGSLE